MRFRRKPKLTDHQQAEALKYLYAVGTTADEVWRLDPKSGEVPQRWTVGGPDRAIPV